MKYRLTTGALKDLASIHSYLQDNASLEIADRFEKKLFKAFDILERLSATGHRRHDMPRSEIRFFNVKPYVIVFRRGPQLVVLRICHASRDLPRVL